MQHPVRGTNRHFFFLFLITLAWLAQAVWLCKSNAISSRSLFSPPAPLSQKRFHTFVTSQLTRLFSLTEARRSFLGTASPTSSVHWRSKHSHSTRDLVFDSSQCKAKRWDCKSGGNKDVLGILSLLKTVGTSPSRKPEWNKFLTKAPACFYLHTLEKVSHLPSEQAVTFKVMLTFQCLHTFSLCLQPVGVTNCLRCVFFGCFFYVF